MSKRIRVLGALSMAGASLLLSVGTAFAASPLWQIQSGNGIFDNLLIVVIGGALLALLATLAGGTIISMLAVGVSRFFRGHLPTDEEMTEMEASLSNSPIPRPQFHITPGGEPFIIAAAVFVVCFALGSVVLSSTPKPVAGNEAPKQAIGLPKTGDFTKIVAGLPPGKSANGAKLYVSMGCSGCHSQEKDKRVVGPSFYGVYDRAKTRVKGMGPKEYIYQSIVDPNAYIVDTFQPNLMPQTFAQQLSPQQISDIITWMEDAHQNQQ